MKNTIPGMLVGLAAFLVLAFSIQAKEKTNSSLPVPAQVESIEIKFDHPKQSKDVAFTATPEDWKIIRAGLLPSKRDPSPSKWEWFGTVKLIKKDGQPFVVEIYTTPDGPRAFAAGTTYKQRVYYRGGNSTELVKAVMDAYKKSLSRE